jgi:hypothetical protein
MRINGGTVIIILVLGVCAAAAIYVTVKTYMWSRQDHAGEPDETKPTAAKVEKKTDEKTPPPG